MKKYSFLGVALLSVMALNAQNQPPVILGNWQIEAISQNSEYAAGKSFSAKIYNLKTGEVTDAGALEAGLGNHLSNYGSMVGNAEGGTALVYMNGRSFAPQSLIQYWFCNINAITPDETRICGTINNPEKGGLEYVPFYCDIDAEGNIGEAQILPYPTEDFTGSLPQFANAIWMSSDGKTILGEVVDRYGYYQYPIVYIQDNDGVWDYSLPTADLYNPQHVEFPTQPWADEPYFPEYKDFMTALAREAYEKAMEDAFTTGVYPDALDYLTPAQIEAYNEAVEVYNNWYYANLENMRNYQSLYFDVLAHSTEFPLNEIKLSPDGSKFVTTALTTIFGGPLNEPIGSETNLYCYDLVKEEGVMVSCPSEWIQPTQILNDGTVIAAYPINSANSGLPTDSFIITPGSEEIIPIINYWEENNPWYAEWVQGNIESGAGYVITNSDMTIFAGSLDEFNFNPNSVGPFNGLAAAAYIFGVGEAGVESIVADASDYKVYNLQGVNVLNVKNKSELSQLPAGIYIINGVKTVVTK